MVVNNKNTCNYYMPRCIFNQVNNNDGYGVGKAEGIAQALSSANLKYTYHKHAKTDAELLDNSISVTQTTQPYAGTTVAEYQKDNAGCFTIPVYKKHTHTGNTTSGGGCYTKATTKTVNYTHTVRSDGYTGVYGTTCNYHSCHTPNIPVQTTLYYYNDKIIGIHLMDNGCHNSNCPLYNQAGSNMNYWYSGGTTAQITAYELGCNKTEGQRYESEGLDYYAPSCGHTNGELISVVVEIN